jgi:hypothetical protein
VPHAIEVTSHLQDRWISGIAGAQELLAVTAPAEGTQEIGNPGHAPAVYEHIFGLEVAVAPPVQNLKAPIQAGRLVADQGPERLHVLTATSAAVLRTRGGPLQKTSRMGALVHPNEVSYGAAAFQILKDHDVTWRLAAMGRRAARNLKAGLAAVEGG